MDFWQEWVAPLTQNRADVCRGRMQYGAQYQYVSIHRQQPNGNKSVLLSHSPQLWEFEAIPPSRPLKDDNLHLLHFHSSIRFYGEMHS